MLLITSWYISLKKKRLRINRRMYKMDEAAWQHKSIGRMYYKSVISKGKILRVGHNIIANIILKSQ